MRIRQATLDEAAVLATVHIESWRAAYNGLIPDSHLAALDVAKRVEQFRREIVDRTVNVDVAERDGEIVGFATFGPSQEADVDRDETGEIQAIYLQPAYWRMGIGRLLCVHAERGLRSTGHRLAVLWVLGENAQARRFYKAMAYEADGTTKTINYGISLEVVRYRKTLENAEQSHAPARARASASRTPVPDR